MTAPPAPFAAPQDILPSQAEGSPGRPRARNRRALHIGVFALGSAAIAILLVAVGWSSIAENLSRIGWYFVLLVVLYAAAQLSFAASWWVLIAKPQPITFGELFAAYLAGDSVNYFTGVGGEPVKAHLVSDKMGFGPAFAGVAVHRHADFLAQWLFLIAGAAIALTHFEIPAFARALVITGLLLLGGLVLGFTRAMRKGVFGPFLRKLSKFRPLAGRLRRFEEEAHRVDERIRLYYHEEEHRGRFGLAVAWGFLGWCGGLLETYIVLRLLSPVHGLPAAVAVESLAMILNSILIFIPARIGTAEGVRVGVTTLLGLSTAQGAAYALARRARELLWLAPGFVVLLKRHVLDVGHMRLEPLDSKEDAS
jgi:uncharacterized protein (TIRG00374 family)